MSKFKGNNRLYLKPGRLCKFLFILSSYLVFGYVSPYLTVPLPLLVLAVTASGRVLIQCGPDRLHFPGRPQPSRRSLN